MSILSYAQSIVITTNAYPWNETSMLLMILFRQLYTTTILPMRYKTHLGLHSTAKSNHQLHGNEHCIWFNLPQPFVISTLN
jgi:hypothetical protein